ncbi:unnamed protein product [Owenia fusiformis]|uniref:Ion transport domain-containing protein n=1 Tax=Owenia fusiformis TaxID=6347 RepID=A0A8S4NNK9_OWEFU|nr:unnamed protein product [Owenia fusiformis]
MTYYNFLFAKFCFLTFGSTGNVLQNIFMYLQIFAIIFWLLVLVSVAVIFIDTVHEFRIPKDSKMDENEKISDPTLHWWFNTTGNPKSDMYQTTKSSPISRYLDFVLNIFFTIELILRFMTVPNKLVFMRNLITIIDIVCVVPALVMYTIIFAVPDYQKSTALEWIVRVAWMLRLLRVLRIFKLTKHYTGLKIFVMALKASWRELVLLLVFILIGVMIFSILIYFAEFSQPDTFPNMVTGLWWGIITMTTVGYGDVYPKSVAGCVIGSLCALSGLIATGLPIPIIANNFNQYYSYANLKPKIFNKRGGLTEMKRFSTRKESQRRTGKFVPDDETIFENDAPFENSDPISENPVANSPIETPI